MTLGSFRKPTLVWPYLRLTYGSFSPTPTCPSVISAPLQALELSPRRFARWPKQKRWAAKTLSEGTSLQVPIGGFVMEVRHPPFVRRSARSRVASRAGDGKRTEPARSWANENTQIDTGPTWTPGLSDFMDAQRRRTQRRRSRVDFPAEILAARESLDALYAAFMRRGDLDKAHSVLCERIKLLSLPKFVQPLTASDVLEERMGPENHALTPGQKPEPDSTLSTRALLTRQPGDEYEHKENDTD